MIAAYPQKKELSMAGGPIRSNLFSYPSQTSHIPFSGNDFGKVMKAK
jgi:hypothetical protein